MMDPRYYEACDALDASVFNGELVSDPENRKGFKAFLERWTRKVQDWESREANS